MPIEIDPLDRLYDLVVELLEDGERATDIRVIVEEAIQEWRLSKTK